MQTVPHARTSLRHVTNVNKKGLEMLHSSGVALSSYMPVPTQVKEIGGNTLERIKEANDIGLGAAKDGIKSMEFTGVILNGDSQLKIEFI